jgi:hypothetical protein
VREARFFGVAVRGDPVEKRKRVLSGDEGIELWRS